MSIGARLTLRTYLYYLGNVLLSALFLMWMSNILWLQCILALGIVVGFSLLCYNEGGVTGEKAVTLSRTLDKRLEEGKRVAPESDRQRFNKKHALVCFLAASLPLFLLATANLIASPRYPEPVEQIQAEVDPFYYDADATGAPVQEDVEPGWQIGLRVVTRLLFAPLLPLYNILEKQPRVLYSLFLPFSFVMPACTAVGYLRGPQIREKKLMDIARGKVRKKRALLVGQNKGPRQPKPQV